MINVKEAMNVVKFAVAAIYFLTCLPVVYLMLLMNEAFTPRYVQRWCYNTIRDIFLSIVTETFYILNRRPFYACVDRNIDKNNRMFLTSNHLSEFDFIFMIRILYETNSTKNIMFVLKKELFSIPIFGDMCKICGFIGVDRNDPNALTVFENDIRRIKNWDKFVVIIFPEGTIWTTPIYKRNCEFAKEKGLKPNTWCLIPKKGGPSVIQKYAAEQHITFVDSTLFFNPWAIDISPMKVKFDYMMYWSDRLSINFILNDESDKAEDHEYYEKSFKKKDVVLKEMKKTGEFKSKAEFIEMLKRTNSYDQKRHMVLELRLGTKIGHVAAVLCLMFYIRLFL